MKNIPVTKPIIGEKEFSAIRTPLESGWLVQGPSVRKFEIMVAQYCNIPHAMATSSCTTALHLSLLSCGIQAGDAVLVPSFTYVATANAVEHAGGLPLFVDIDLETFNISCESAEALMDRCENQGMPLPKAIVPVHQFGLCADMGLILELSEKYSLKVIEDAACALGSMVEDNYAGTFGDAGCFSFHPRKVITTGEGGMAVTRDKATESLLRMLRDHGAEASDLSRHNGNTWDLPEFNLLGYNYRMTDLQGALGTVQMERLPELIRARQSLAETYRQLLDNIPWLKTPLCPEGHIHTYQSFVCRIEFGEQSISDLGRIRSALMKHLSDAGISTRPGTHAIHLLGYYRKKYGLEPELCPNALNAHYGTITLPLFPGMAEEEQTYVVDIISRFKP